jgi:hypothetical protein
MVEFNSEQKYTILNKLHGYTGSTQEDEMSAFINSSPGASATMRKMTVAANKMAKANQGIMISSNNVDPELQKEFEEFQKFKRMQKQVVGYQEGGSTGTGETEEEKKAREEQEALAKAASEKAKAAMSDPASLVEKAEVEKIDPTTGEIDPTAGQITGTPEKVVAEKGKVTTVDTPEDITTSTATTATTTEDVKKATEGFEGAKGEVSEEAKVAAATKDPTSTEVGTVDAAVGEAVKLENPVTRELQEGELISGSADAAKAAKFTEEVQAATATPSEKATVAGQLAKLTEDFDANQPPPWAAGALRGVMSSMAARGIASSSMTGQAMVQAALESALPIASADAATQAQFEAQNLSNRQQRAMLAAQQRADFLQLEFNQDFQARVQNASKISDIANMNFTAEQQVALENSRAANTMALANLNNKQAVVMAEAAAIANLEMANLSNEQQAAVQNAQAFLQMDFANLNNEQQAAMFSMQSVVQGIFTDTAAENAASQFNATSENQTKQFMATLKNNTAIQNATMTNAMEQSNVNQENAIRQYNSQIQEQRNQFNATNSLVIAQANAVWRQNVETINTAAQNDANKTYAKEITGLNNKAIDEIWQRERDIMDKVFTASESSKERALNLLLGDMEMDALDKKLKAKNDEAIGNFIGKLIFGGLSGNFSLGNIFGA